jgi:hypothetical protein
MEAEGRGQGRGRQRQERWRKEGRGKEVKPKGIIAFKQHSENMANIIITFMNIFFARFSYAYTPVARTHASNGPPNLSLFNALAYYPRLTWLAPGASREELQSVQGNRFTPFHL